MYSAVLEHGGPSKGSVAERYLNAASDPSFTLKMASIFENTEPAPAVRVFYDPKIKDTDVLAYYNNPREVLELCPNDQRELISLLLKGKTGNLEPYIALNPGILTEPEELVYSVIKHEQSHAAQPKGKLTMLGVYADTPFGSIDLGRMFVEGWNEYGLEKKGEKPPSRYFDEMYGYGKAAYSQCRDFVYDVEAQSPGITRQIMRAASKGGPNAAISLIEGIPNIGKIVTEYAWKLNNRMN
jgi:hypothetical protein